MNSDAFSKETIIKIIRNKKRLESKLNVKLRLENNKVMLEGEEVDIFVAKQVIEAIDLGFNIPVSLFLIDENYMLEKINIKDVTKKKNIETIKGRIIGRKGKTLSLLSELSECYIELKENIVGVLGPADKVKEAETAVKSLIRGSKQSNVYSYLERQKKKDIPGNLGLKIKH